ncbi:MAG: type II secretion system F family protein [Candidatus Nanoarchaeia archaeon]
MSDVSDLAKKIEGLADDVAKYYKLKSDLDSFLKGLQGLSKRDAEKKKKEFLKGKTESEWFAFYDDYIAQQLNEIKVLNEAVMSSLGGKEVLPKPPKEKVVQPAQVKQTAKLPASVVPSSGFVALDKKTKQRYIKELNLELDYLKNLMPAESTKKKIILTDYTIYKSSPFGNLANRFFEGISMSFNKQYPKFFDNLSLALRAADIKVLSKTYFSMILLCSLIGFFFGFLIGLVLINQFIVFRITLAFFIGIILAAMTGVFVYAYPSIVANSRKKRIKDDLPFVVLHMAAIAGSGAQPISMFNLILSSGEYKGIEGEIKKIVNYVNLFGYNLTTALRAVSLTTPSNDFRDLLNGLVTTIESGGDLKSFLNSKADEIMTNYKLERKKYVETLGTYSDVYTGILIAAPLLFFITLAIIRMFGTDFMGVSISTIASIGTYGLIPLLNIGFIIFLNMIQPST